VNLKQLLCAVFVLCALHPALADDAGSDEGGTPGEILLNGKLQEVIWNDGDTLTFLSGLRKGKSARLVGYNTLESYGPVHRWGEWTRLELHDFATAGKQAAAAKTWECSTRGKKDSYKRLLVDCPQARRELIAQGLAHVFAYAGEPDSGDIDAQRHARMEQTGMWEKGRPEHIVTNVSADEGGRVFLRVVNARTGKTEVRHQREDYETCDEICHGPEVSGSCMLFVPHSQRYSNRPDCIE